MANPYVEIDPERAVAGVLSRANASISPDLALSHWVRMDPEKSCSRIATALNDHNFTWAYKDYEPRMADIDASL